MPTVTDHLDTNIEQGSILTSDFPVPGMAYIANPASVAVVPPYTIPVLDSGGDPTYLYAKEIKSVEAPAPPQPGPLAELLKALFAPAEPVEQPEELPLVEALRKSARITFPSAVGEDEEGDRAEYNSAIIFLSARYSKPIYFGYRKEGASDVTWHTLNISVIEQGEGDYFLVGGNDDVRGGAFRKFRTDRIVGTVET